MTETEQTNDVGPAAPNDDAAALSPSLKRVGWQRSTLNLVLILCLGLIGGSGLLVSCETKNSAVRNTNVGSRYGQVEGLVNHGTYAITKTRYNRTIDKVRLPNGDYISSKPPLLPTVTAGVYWVYRAVTGYDIRTDEKKVVLFCNLVMGAFLHVIMLIFWLRLLLLITPKPEVVVLSVAMVAFGFLGMGYAIELNNHSVAACMTTVGFYFAYRIRNEFDVHPRHWAFVGLIFGFLPAVDVPSGLVSAAVLVYLLTYDWKQTVKRALPFAIPGPIVAATLNYLVTGSILPVQMQPALRRYPGSYWANPKGVDALDEPKYIYGFNVLIGHHGIFSITPALILGWVYAVRTFAAKRAKKAMAFMPETTTIAVITAILMAWYIYRTHNYGGNCVGFRWAIAWTPLMFVMVAFYLATTKLQPRHVFYVMAATGITMWHNWQAFWTPWHESKWQRFVAGILKNTVGW